jgi:hypothetical protein
MVLERQEHVHVDIIIVDPPRKGLDLDVSRALLWKTMEDEVAIVATKATALALSSSTSSSPSSSMSQIRRTKQQILIYVSCGFDAFVRDYHILTKPPGATTSGTTASGHPPLPFRSSTAPAPPPQQVVPWQLDHAEGHVLFPGSDAIETLAIFTR